VDIVAVAKRIVQRINPDCIIWDSEMYKQKENILKVLKTMEKEEIIKDLQITLATNLLYSLHAFNKLDNIVVNIISEAFNVDAKEICKKQGITYFIK
jgi:hypothetical protein